MNRLIRWMFLISILLIGLYFVCRISAGVGWLKHKVALHEKYPYARGVVDHSFIQEPPTIMTNCYQMCSSVEYVEWDEYVERYQETMRPQ